MDKNTMDKTLKEASELIGNFEPTFIKALAQNQYNNQFAELGNMAISLSISGFIGDDRRADIARENIKSALSALDALCEQFGLVVKHDEMKKIIGVK